MYDVDCSLYLGLYSNNNNDCKDLKKILKTFVFVFNFCKWDKLYVVVFIKEGNSNGKK